MPEITAAAVKALRNKTDLPMMLCKKALMEAEGDEEKAKEILKREGLKVKEKRADNPTEEGRIFTGLAPDGEEAVMVEVVCESAPVATGQDMARFGEKLVAQYIKGTGAATPEELLAQKDPESGKPLSELFDEMINKIREKMVVTRVIRMRGPVGAYVHHDHKTGVLFQASGGKKQTPVLKDVAMHIAALKPVVCYPEELDPALVEKSASTCASRPRNRASRIISSKKSSKVSSRRFTTRPACSPSSPWRRTLPKR